MEQKKGEYMKSSKQKRLLLFLLMTILCYTLVGCGKFPASKYVQSCLDCSFHGDFTTYIEMTKSSEEEVKAAYENLIESEVNSLSAAYNVSDEQKDKFRSLFADMYKLCKYEVGEATDGENKSYIVPVTTYKLTVFEGVTEETEKFVDDYFNNHKDFTADELYAAVLDNMYDIVRERIENPNYAEGVTTNITVSPSIENPNIYTMDPLDLQNMVFNLIDIENQK